LSCKGNHRARNAAAFSINSRKFVEIHARRIDNFAFD
jgi:hypothetical protein